MRLSNERLLERLEALENRQLPNPEPTAQVADENVDECLDPDDAQALRDEVAALRSEPSKTRALPPGATSARIDRALEVEMRTEHEDGVMVKAVRWLERKLRGK